MMYPYGIGGGWPLMTITMVLFWVLVIGAAVAGVRYVLARHCQAWFGPALSRSAQDVLAKRFVCDEIDEQDYRRRLAVLRDSGGQAAADRGRV